MSKKNKKNTDLMDLQEALLRLASSQTDDGFEALKALVWAAVDMSEITLQQIRMRMGDQPAAVVGGLLISRKKLDELEPEDFLRSVVEIGIDIRKNSRKKETD